jgi:hypothetical protein
MRVTLTAANQKIDVYSLKFLQLGSIKSSDLENLSLWVGATQIGSTVSNLEDDGSVFFDLSDSPYQVPNGVQRIISLKADVIGGSTRNIQFSLQKSSDVVAMDNNYGVYVTPYTTGTYAAGTATWGTLDSVQCTVSQGNLVISKRTDSPSGNIALNSSNVSLAKFDVKAVGENVKVSSLRFSIASSTWQNINNVKLFWDGMQIGTVQNPAVGGTTYTKSVNFTALVGETKVLEIKSDIQGSGISANDSITATLVAGASNAQRQTSLGTFNFPTANTAGNALTINTSTLTGSKNLSLGDITAVNGQLSTTIGSYLLTAGAAEGVDISLIRFEDAASNATTTAGSNQLGACFGNLELYYGDTQLGTTITPNPASPAATYNFYPSDFSLAAGQTVTINLKADVNSTGTCTWTNSEATKISRIESTGQVTTNAANFTTQAAGQGLTITDAGTLSGSARTDELEPAILGMGSTDNTLGIWRLNANSVEDLTVSKILILVSSNATSSGSVQNLKLYCGDDQYGPTVESISDSTTDYAAFGGTCVVPKGSYKVITLKGNVTSYANSAFSGGSYIRTADYVEFYLRIPATITGTTADTLTARGAGDYALTTASTNTASRMYPYRTSLSAAIAVHGSATSRTRGANDKVADLTLTGTASADAQFRAVGVEPSDEVATNWNVASDASQTASAVAISTTQKIDGTYSIKYTASATAATTTWVAVDTGTALNGYSKVSMWVYPDASTSAASPFIIFTDSTSTAYINFVATTTAGTLTADKWNFVEVSVPAAVTATSTCIGFGANLAGSDQYIAYLDVIKAYNDSINIDVTGNLGANATGTVWYLKTTGGTQKAIGYFDAINGKATLIPSALIEVGSSAVTLEVITNTTRMLAAETTAVETMSLSLDLGDAAGGTITAGDFRWYDQGTKPTGPITWMNGASPISVSLGY